MATGSRRRDLWPIQLEPGSISPQILTCAVPDRPYQGYLVDVQLTGAESTILDERRTAIDISPDWKIFPRYGYLAHFSAKEGADPKSWIADLNRFHIDGLQFYDFQYRHDQPLAGTVAHPQPSWNDIAGRTVEGAIVNGFIAQAHRYNMMAMAYNSATAPTKMSSLGLTTRSLCNGLHGTLRTVREPPQPPRLFPFRPRDGPRTSSIT